MKDRNALILGGLIIILLVGGWLVSGGNKEDEQLPEEQGQEQVSQSALYFAEELTRPASPEGPFPIEGYDAGLLLGKYSNLAPEDFEGVESFQGVYAVEEGVVAFTLTEEYEHSAARTLSSKGYETLLANVSSRLQLPSETTEDIDAIVAMLK